VAIAWSEQFSPSSVHPPEKLKIQFSDIFQVPFINGTLLRFLIVGMENIIEMRKKSSLVEP